MKFPRNARLLRSPFDVAPFAAVFFLLVIFLLLGALLPVPGIPLRLPAAGDLPGTDRPTVSVAIDSQGRFYVANQIMAGQTQLEAVLRAARRHSREPLTLVIQADQSVTYAQLVRLTLLARRAGIDNALLATLPRGFNVTDRP